MHIGWFKLPPLCACPQMTYAKSPYEESLWKLRLRGESGELNVWSSSIVLLTFLWPPHCTGSTQIESWLQATSTFRFSCNFSNIAFQRRDLIRYLVFSQLCDWMYRLFLRVKHWKIFLLNVIFLQWASLWEDSHRKITCIVTPGWRNICI